MNKIKIKLNICGADYNVISDDEESHVLEIGRQVNKRMTEILGSNSRISTSMAAILTALEYCDELYKVSHKEKLNSKYELDEANSKIKLLETQINDLKKEVSNVQKENTELIDELSDSRLVIKDLTEKQDTKESDSSDQNTEYDVLNFFDFAQSIEK